MQDVPFTAPFPPVLRSPHQGRSGAEFGAALVRHGISKVSRRSAGRDRQVDISFFVGPAAAGQRDNRVIRSILAGFLWARLNPNRWRRDGFLSTRDRTLLVQTDSDGSSRIPEPDRVYV